MSTLEGASTPLLSSERYVRASSTRRPLAAPTSSRSLFPQHTSLSPASAPVEPNLSPLAEPASREKQRQTVYSPWASVQFAKNQLNLRHCFPVVHGPQLFANHARPLVADRPSDYPPAIRQLGTADLQQRPVSVPISGVCLFYQFLRRAFLIRLLYVICFSLYFYYKTSGWFVLVLIGLSLSDFTIGYFIANLRSRAGRKWLLALSLTLNLGMLCYFKYTNFFIEILNGFRPGYWLDFQNIFLPVGISFFTFQSMSYVIDIYRERIKPVYQWIDYLFYLSFFPQLVAGPIVRARDFIPKSIKTPSSSAAKCSAGEST